MLADRSRHRLPTHRPPAGKPPLRVRLVLDQMADAIAFLERNGHGPADAARIAADVMTRKVNEAYRYRRPEPPTPERNDVPAKDLTVGLLPDIKDVEAAIEINGRERKRLFTIRRLVLDTEDAAPDAAPEAAAAPAGKAKLY